LTEINRGLTPVAVSASCSELRALRGFQKWWFRPRSACTRFGSRYFTSPGLSFRRTHNLRSLAVGSGIGRKIDLHLHQQGLDTAIRAASCFSSPALVLSTPTPWPSPWTMAQGTPSFYIYSDPGIYFPENAR